MITKGVGYCGINLYVILSCFTELIKQEQEQEE